MGRGRVFNAARARQWDGFDLRIRIGHNAARWRVYIAARGGRRARRVRTGTACNLVIDQFVTIWRFVCADPVNGVYPGPDDRRVNAVRVWGPTRTGPDTSVIFLFLLLHLLVFLCFSFFLHYAQLSLPKRARGEKYRTWNKTTVRRLSLEFWIYNVCDIRKTLSCDKTKNTLGRSSSIIRFRSLTWKLWTKMVILCAKIVNVICKLTPERTPLKKANGSEPQNVENKSVRNLMPVHKQNTFRESLKYYLFIKKFEKYDYNLKILWLKKRRPALSVPISFVHQSSRQA